jgi:hypothetical protein
MGGDYIARGARAVLWLLLGFLSSCADLSGPKYPIVDSGYTRVPGTLSKSLYWIDSRRVLFHGYREGADSTRPAQSGDRSSLYVWDTMENVVTPYAYSGPLEYFCLKDGYVRYVIHRDDKGYARRGKLGEEREAVLLPEPEDPDLVVRVNPHNCREYRRIDLPRRKSFSFLPLREEHGYWGFDDSRERDKPLLLLNRDATKLVALPIEAQEGRRIRYSAYAEGYVISRITGLAELRDRPTKVWLLYPSGRVDTIPIPKGPWTAHDAGYVPTRAGLIMTSRGLTAGAGPGVAGIYLVNGDHVEKILPGLIEDIDVAPDGCKVAFSVNPYTSNVLRSRVKMIDVCNKGG